MGVTIHVRDVDPDTKARLDAAAEAAGKSLSAYLREKLDEIAEKPKREFGYLRDVLGDIGDPLDKWFSRRRKSLFQPFASMKSARKFDAIGGPT